MEHNPFGRKQVRATEETVGVVGKQFPATQQSDFYARCPTLVLVLSVVMPVVFMFIGIGSDIAIDVSLDGFVADPHESTTSANIINGLTSAWTGLISGTTTLESSVDGSKTKSKVEFRQEIRFDISLPEFSNWYYGQYLPGTSNPESFTAVSNLLRKENMQYIRAIEKIILSQDPYTSMCFTNNLKYGGGRVTSYPTCAPLTSLTQNFFPGTYSIIPSGVDFPMDGQGLTYQVPYQNVVARVLSNPNYRWFVDKTMTNLNPYTRSLRAQLTFATPFTVGTSTTTLRTVRNFISNINQALSYLMGSHAFIYFSYGGDQVQDALVDSALQQEYYKLGVMVLIVAVVAWFHTRTFILTVCMVCQLLLTYLASWGLYITVYDSRTNNVASASQDDTSQKALPLLSSVSLFLIISFCLHGTLTFYDTFVHSGIMATTGRRNNLSVSQRIAFAMRRASFGITIANLIAIVVFGINATSAFKAVRDFSVMMIFSLLFNLYFAWTTTPAYVLWHHYYFSRKRRIAQKQREVVTEHADDVRRHSALNEVLQQVQMHLRPDEESFMSMATKEQILNEAEEAKWKIFVREGAGAIMTDTKRELDEVIASIRKNRDSAARRHAGDGGESNFMALADGAEEFKFEMFVDVNALQDTTFDQYFSERLVPASRILHIPLDHTLRTAENVVMTAEAAAIAQPNKAPVQQPPPQTGNNRPRNMSSSDIDVGNTTTTSEPIIDAIPTEMGPDAMSAWWSRWEAASKKLALSGISDGSTHPLQPLLAYNVCVAHDPYWVASESSELMARRGHYLGFRSAREGNEAGGDTLNLHAVQQLGAEHAALGRIGDEGGEGFSNVNQLAAKEEQRPPSQHSPTGNARPPTAQSRRSQRAGQQAKKTEEYKNFFGKMKHRWKVRNSEERQYCCGMLGSRINETREERDARILARATKKEGYGRVERILTQFVAPWIDAWKYPLLLMFAALFIVSIVLSTYVKPAGVPKTLLVDVSAATTYANMGNLYAQSGTCDFCGLYYRPYNTPAMATERELVICPSQAPNFYTQQMNVIMDKCDVCGGSNACFLCNGDVPRGSNFYITTTCGTCALTNAQCTTCLSTDSCTYCTLRNGTATAGYGGSGCATQCTNCGGHGSCNAFTGLCDCDRSSSAAYDGATCSGCADGFTGAGCEQECDASGLSSPCNCNITSGRCTTCPAGKRGYNCVTDSVYCLHGTMNAAATGCDCDPGWQDGGSCTLHESCTFRGVLYTTAEAPMNGCGCIGNWVGQSCTSCACLNGGSCNANGTCSCVGSFYGDQCQLCPTTCSRYGTCPTPLSPSYMNLRQCLGQCTFAQQDSGTICAPCSSISWPTTPTCSAYTTKLSCNTDLLCLWYVTSCVSVVNPLSINVTAMTTCSCKGAWSGSACSVCNGPNGSTCLADGTIKACDGFTYSSSAGAPAVDKCGVCGGSGNCIGCDGIPNSGKVYDSCGVCGGDNGCLGTTSASPVSVTFLVDVHSYITLQTYQYQSLAAYCKKLQDMAAQGVIIDTVSCVISDYITWQTQGAGYTSTNTTQLDIHRLYTYAYGAGRIGDLIFSDTNGNSSTLQLLYVVNTVNLPILTVAPNARIFDLYESMLAIAGQLEGQLRDSGLSDASVRQTSTSWANAVAAEVSLATLKFTAGIGIAMAFCIMGSFFANFRLSLFATMSVVFVFCGTLAVAYTQGWDIDAVTQICVAGVIAVAVEHLVHIVDGYQDFLQSTQTHMFALSTTCMHAFRGSLTRTGVSIISSTIATVAVALLFVVSAIQPFRRAAQVMITVHIFTLITAVLFGAALCAFGPTVLIRHWAATTVLCCTCAVCGAIALLIIYLAGGVAGPSGYSVP